MSYNVCAHCQAEIPAGQRVFLLAKNHSLAKPGANFQVTSPADNVRCFKCLTEDEILCFLAPVLLEGLNMVAKVVNRDDTNLACYLIKGFLNSKRMHNWEDRTATKRVLGIL